MDKSDKGIAEWAGRLARDCGAVGFVGIDATEGMYVKYVFLQSDLVRFVRALPEFYERNGDPEFWNWIKAEREAGRDHHVFSAKAGFDAGRALPAPPARTPTKETP